MHTPTSTIPVFVFGSNLAGRHGKGAALWARQHRGAIYGQGVGRQGNAYAIPTKDRQLLVLPLHVIQAHVADFLDYARQRPDITFESTPIGCGLAGYRPDQIAPMFSSAPANVTLPDAFSAALAAGPPPS
ncbi:MAG: hypothetical protein EKK35_21385 [Bradyrhizobiaceae bacterium]|jgi:hypothetical protein|nr:MAG: hypothetical protein EKK35_21385 [Bradyrhizobiaceae bacterium]